MAELITRINADINQMTHLKGTDYYKKVVKLRDDLLAEYEDLPEGYLEDDYV